MNRELLHPPETVTGVIGTDQIAALSLNAPAIDVIQDGRGRDFEIHAYVNLPQHTASEGALPERIGLSIRKDHRGFKRVMAIAFDEGEQGALIAHDTLDFRPNAVGHSLAEGSPVRLRLGSIAPTREKPEGALVVTVGHKDNSEAGLAKGIPQTEVSAKIECSPHALELEKVSSLSRFLRNRNNLHNTNKEATSRARKWAARFAAGLAIYGAVHSGGLIDRTAEVFHDAGDSVTENFQEPGDYSRRLPDIPPHMAMEGDNGFKEAVQRVAEVMDNWDGDGGGIEAIRGKAEAFRAEHKDSLMPEADVNAYHQRLQEASNNDEALKVLQDYMGFFSKKVSFLDNPFEGINALDSATANLEDIKLFGGSVIDAYSYLPKELIKAAGFDTLKLGASDSLDVAGKFTGSSLLFPIDKPGSIMGRALDTPVGGAIVSRVAGPKNTTHTILHETIHSLEGEPVSTTSKMEPIRWLGTVGSSLAGIPAEASEYAARSRGNGEALAEEGAVALDAKSDNFIASPQQWRQFISSTNGRSREILTDLEISFPGLTAHLVDVHLQYKNQQRR